MVDKRFEIPEASLLAEGIFKLIQKYDFSSAALTADLRWKTVEEIVELVQEHLEEHNPCT